MKRTTLFILRCCALAISLIVAPTCATADDIDIFTGASAGSAINPRILIVVDNTSNWARQSQKWPGGLSQGQAEMQAIQTMIASLNDSVNVGLMEFVTGGNANTDGGYVRSAIKPMNATNKASFNSALATIYNNITASTEKRNSNTAYGNLMYDAYNYYAGAMSTSPSAIVAGKADPVAYANSAGLFNTPLDQNSTCAKNFVVFIGNADSSGPTSDGAANTAALAALGGVTTQLGLPNFTIGNATTNTSLGKTAQCYASGTAATAGLSDYAATCTTYTQGCTIGNATINTSPIACPVDRFSYSVTRRLFTPSTTTTSGPTTGTPVLTSAPTTGRYASAGAVNPILDHGNLVCPARTTSGASATTYACTYATGAAVNNVTTSTETTSACYRAVSGGSGSTYWSNTTDYAGLSCPSGNTCTYSGINNVKEDCSGKNNNIMRILVTQTATPKLNRYTITQSATSSTVTTTTTAATTSSTVLGETAQCFAAIPADTDDYAGQCRGTNVSCSYGSPSATLASCPAGSSVYDVIGTNTILTNVATGTSNVDTGPRNADEWARFLHDKGIPVAGSSIKPSVTTYTIDVYNAQPNATQTALLMSMAKAGGGKYFAARSGQAIVDALKQIVIEIQAVNSSFASTSLPVNATNRSQNENQVFIGMFRPDPDAKQRWFGNVKRYQLISSGASIELGDVNGALAVNTVAGFVTPCATSYWTSDSGNYWAGLGINPDPAGTCNTTVNNAYSDAPDGPQVEKGGAAEILRQGNNPPLTSNNPTWAVNRIIHTEVGAALTPFSVASSGLDASLVNFISGFDVDNDKGTGSTLTTRPSIHGDVIHSRPLPVNYGSSSGNGNGVTIYYGANDGALRAVNAATGAERWAFIAPEFFPRLARLQSNSPLVTYPNRSAITVPMPTARDYFFDGSTGIYQNADNSKVWIFPTMRRGGRMLYALDVSNPNSPRFKWKSGCPHFSDDIGCSPGMAGIGQTWSTPAVAFIKGYSSTTPVLIVGGGYDNCEDGDTPTPACGATKGGIIYILDADSGSVVASFLTARAVAADISLVDIDNDGFPDYAYGADTGGGLYRIDFIDNASTRTPLASSAWRHKRVAHTSTGYRKFLHAPALLALGTQVYLALGSGDREHPLRAQYPYASVVNRFYVLKDDLTSNAASTDLDTLQDNTGNTDCQARSVLPGSNLQGWFMNLNQHGQGEQVVTSALIAGGMVTFSTNRAIDVGTACSNALGQARGYWVNLFNASGAIDVAGSCGGIRSNTFVGGGLPPSPIMASRVPIGSRQVSVVIGAIQKGSGVSVSISPQKIRPTITSKRKRIYSYVSGQ
jgi:hypothetical protein